MALQALEELVRTSTPQQLAVYNKLIEKHPALAVNCNRSGAKIGVKLVGKNEVDSTRKFGLEWLMALARVELGGFAAAYGNSDHPFKKMPPTKFEMSAFLVLLVDDFRVHLKAMAEHRSLAQQLQFRFRAPNSSTMAFIRWFNVSISFAKAIWEYSGKTIPEAEAIALYQSARELEQKRLKLILFVQNYLKSDVDSKEHTVSMTTGVEKWTTPLKKPKGMKKGDFRRQIQEKYGFQERSVITFDGAPFKNRKANGFPNQRK